MVENPHLHLVWYYDRIFIKPIPPYLLSHAFWQYLEYADQDLLRTAAGFLRTYAYLIQYESDFKKAQSSELRLIPKDDGEKEITFERFATFIATFAKVDDAQVTPRYHYGELRLSRLNLWAPVLFGKLTFHHINAQWSVFLTKFFAFALAAFLVLTTILNAMQVELAIQSISNTSDSWNVFAQVSRWFSVLVLLAVRKPCIWILILRNRPREISRPLLHPSSSPNQFTMTAANVFNPGARSHISLLWHRVVYVCS